MGHRSVDLEKPKARGDDLLAVVLHRVVRSAGKAGLTGVVH
jgi:hypothetical protein